MSSDQPSGQPQAESHEPHNDTPAVPVQNQDRNRLTLGPHFEEAAMPPGLRQVLKHEPIWPFHKRVSLNDPHEMHGLGVEKDATVSQHSGPNLESTVRARSSRPERRYMSVHTGNDLDAVVKERYGPNVYPFPIHHIEQLLQYDTEVDEAYLASMHTKHIFSLFDDEEFCGYRCMQMLTSDLVERKDAENLFEKSRLQKAEGSGSARARFDRSYFSVTSVSCGPLTADCSTPWKALAPSGHMSDSFRSWTSRFVNSVPNIPDIQKSITRGWGEKINPAGEEQTGGISETRKWIGAIDADTFFKVNGINCRFCKYATHQLNIGDPPRPWRQLIGFLKCYFQGHDNPIDEPEESGKCEEDKVKRSGKPPVFLQMPGHSVVIVGIEKRSSLPASKDSQEGMWKRARPKLRNAISRGQKQSEKSTETTRSGGKGAVVAQDTQINALVEPSSVGKDSTSEGKGKGMFSSVGTANMAWHSSCYFLLSGE